MCQNNRLAVSSEEARQLKVPSIKNMYRVSNVNSLEIYRSAK